MGFPNEINVGRFNRLLQRLLQMKGGAPSPVLVPELQATLLLESDRLEWEWLKGAQLFGRRRAVTAGGAGNFSTVEFVNPAQSGALATLLHFSVNQNTEFVELELDAGAGLGGTGLAGTAVDSRMPTTRPSTMISQILTTAASALANPFMRIGVNKDLLFPRGFAVLAPNSLLRFGADVANTGFQVNLLWLERAIEQSELG